MLLILTPDQGTQDYMSTDGALVFEDTFSKGEALARHVAVARDGSTVAVTLDRTKGSDFWDTGHGIKLVATYILVYDLSVSFSLLLFFWTPFRMRSRFD